MKKILIACQLACSSIVFAQTPAELLQVKLNAIQSMTANFTQVVKAKKHEISRSSGTMALKKPGRFRWQTKLPMQQLIIADGKKMWVYDVDLEQVTVTKQKKGLSGSAALFLSDYDNKLMADFDVTQQVSDSGRLINFNLKSKFPKNNFQRIQLIFTQNNLTGLELYDQLEQVTSVKFNQIKSNPKLSAQLFHFTLPKGVDVL